MEPTEWVSAAYKIRANITAVRLSSAVYRVVAEKGSRTRSDMFQAELHMGCHGHLLNVDDQDVHIRIYSVVGGIQRM